MSKPCVLHLLDVGLAQEYTGTCQEYTGYVKKPGFCHNLKQMLVCRQGDYGTAFREWGVLQLYVAVIVAIIVAVVDVIGGYVNILNVTVSLIVQICAAYLFAHLGWFGVVKKDGCFCCIIACCECPPILLFWGILMILWGISWFSLAFQGIGECAICIIKPIVQFIHAIILFYMGWSFGFRELKSRTKKVFHDGLGWTRCGQKASPALSRSLPPLAGYHAAMELDPSAASKKATMRLRQAEHEGLVFCANAASNLHSPTWASLDQLLENEVASLRALLGGRPIWRMGCVSSGCAFARIVGDRVHHSGSKRYHRHCALENDYNQSRQVLGRGFSGTVMLGRSVQTEDQVAIKTLRVSLSDIMDGEKAIKHMAREVDVLLSVNHPNIVALVDVYEMPTSITLVMELLQGGTLQSHLLEQERLMEEEAACVTRQMMKAVDYLHCQLITHRDLKPDNFMFAGPGFGEGDLKLIDFGFCKHFTPGKLMKSSKGSLSYMAPEVLQHKYTFTCDIWSLGVIVFRCLSGYLPFQEQLQFHPLTAQHCEDRPCG
eukprot:s2671_g4.t1